MLSQQSEKTKKFISCIGLYLANKIGKKLRVLCVKCVFNSSELLSYFMLIINGPF